VRRLFSFTSIGLVVAALGGAWVGYAGRPLSRIMILDVGQGDATLIQSDGRTLLIDTGPNSDNRLGRKLRSLRVAALDGIFLTHPDLDHINGTAAIAEEFPDAPILISAAFRTHPELEASLRLWKLKDRVRWVSDRGTLQMGTARLEVYVPAWMPGTPDNDGSMLTRFCVADACFVNSGDASTALEPTITDELKWTANLVKAGHHGSRTSTSEALLSSLGATDVAISCGRNNRFRHPHPEVLERVNAAGLKVHRTDESGTITFEIRSGRWQRVN
jgi:hypothetical protein